MAAAATLLLLGLASAVHGYYLPGANPRSYGVGSELKLKVNKLSSQHSLYPRDYYSLPFCRPVEGIVHEGENLGEFLAGDRIENSPYTLYMKKDTYCKELCANNLGRGEHRGTSPNKAVAAIREDYHNNWIVDGLNAASRTEDDETIITNFHEGFPIGFIADHDGKAYIHNHVNIEISYNTVGDNQYRVVQFIVEPFSIKHDFDPEIDEAGNVVDYHINNPIASCDKNIPTESRQHTDYDMVTDASREPQEASGKVLFTYDVIWKEDNDIKWADRWNIYLDMKRTFPSSLRWFSIVRKMIIVLILSAMVAAILVRNLRRDINRYNSLATDEEKQEELEEYGWKLVHADVFRPPSFAPMFLAICCGTGAELLGTMICTIVLSSLGFMSPARRGHLLIAELILFVFMGAIGGYVMARLYKTFKGKRWQLATILMALGYPGLSFTVFSIVNIAAISQQSTDAVPFVTILVLMILWLGISTPMVFIGAYFGYKQDAIDFPVNSSSLPRQIPDQPWFLWVFCTAFICGVLPYGSCVVEMQMIMGAMWQETYYYVFGFLFVVFLMLLVTCAEITVLFTYFQLCNENYHWWWRSFINGGATAPWVLLYSTKFFREIEVDANLATYVLFFGYMLLISAGLFTILGAVGMGTSLWFNKTVYASIKID